MKIAIIGGGASGTVCAISIKQQDRNASVTVYERLPRVLKKILVTGNGRCNLTNLNSSQDFFRGDTELVRPAFSKYPPKSNIEFFNKIGLLTFTEAQGRVYPMSAQANSVVNALLGEAKRLGVEFVTDTQITKIDRQNGCYILNGKFKADKIVISCGGSAAKAQGTDGSSFKLLKALGVKIREPKPALTGVVIKNFPASLKGVRRVSNIRINIDCREVYSELGEVQYNDYGISGIPVMQLSGLVSTSNSDNIRIIIDSVPEIDINYLKEFLNSQKQHNPEMTAETLAAGIVPKSLGSYILKTAGIKNAELLKDINKNRLELFAAALKEISFEAESVRDFQYAQTTAGGVLASELNHDTLEIKALKGVFVTGEAVNVDGLCGGHNLQWAWSSGRLAADGILKEN